MVKDSFSVRRPLSAPLGTAGQHADGQVQDARLRSLRADVDLEAFLARDEMPIPPTSYREGYYDDRHFEYWLSGLDDYLKVMAVTDSLAGAESPQVLDFGGASGRVARHFAAHAGARVTLCDLDINNVDWVAQHLDRVRTFKNSVLPHLPLQDGRFDLVTAFSVFTHIDVYELAWLYELRRLLKPKGMLYVTIHDEHTWHVLSGTPLLEVLRLNDAFNRVCTSEELPGERLVFEYSDCDAYNCNVFHSASYVRRAWARCLTVTAVLPGQHGYQAAVVMENRD